MLKKLPFSNYDNNSTLLLVALLIIDYLQQ